MTQQEVTQKLVNIIPIGISAKKMKIHHGGMKISTMIDGEDSEWSTRSFKSKKRSKELHRNLNENQSIGIILNVKTSKMSQCPQDNNTTSM
jgi:hypothetical protein